MSQTTQVANSLSEKVQFDGGFKLCQSSLHVLRVQNTKSGNQQNFNLKNPTGQLLVQIYDTDSAPMVGLYYSINQEDGMVHVEVEVDVFSIVINSEYTDVNLTKNPDEHADVNLAGISAQKKKYFRKMSDF